MFYGVASVFSFQICNVSSMARGGIMEDLYLTAKDWYQTGEQLEKENER